jgi:hypothetical protein
MLRNVNLFDPVACSSVLMARLLMTANDVREILSRRIHAIQAVVDDSATIFVPLPSWNGPDEDGCNWHMWYFGGDAAAYTQAIARVIAVAQGEFQLKD